MRKTTGVKDVKNGAPTGTVLFEATLDSLPPTVNHFYRTAGAGKHRYKTAEGRSWQALAVAAMREANSCPDPYAGHVALEIGLTSKNRVRWDVDNRIKALQDCLSAAGVLRDDVQVVELWARRIFGTSESTLIRVRACD